MKKWIVLCLVLCGLYIVPSARAEIRAGDVRLSLYGGITAGLQNSSLEFANKNFAWGHVGGELGFSGMYFPVEYLGIGADIRYATFSGSDKEIWDTSSFPYHRHKIDMDMDTFHLMATGRAYINPQDSLRCYIPFGTGLTVATGKFNYGFDNLYEINTSATNASLGYFVGFGFEYQTSFVGDILTPSGTGSAAWGLEVRYNVFTYDLNRLAERINDPQRPGKEKYSYLSFLLTLSF